MDLKSQFEKTKQVLQGLELLYPRQDVIKRTRYALDNITNKERQSPEVLIADFFKIVEFISDADISLSPLELKNILLEIDTFVSLYKLAKRVQETNSQSSAAIPFRKMYYRFLNNGDDIHAFDFLAQTTGLQLMKNIVALKNQDLDSHLHECFSQGQIKSKKWLVDELIKAKKLNYSNVEIHCGWYALLAHLLFKSQPKLEITSYDNDPKVEEVARILNHQDQNYEQNFKAETKDIYTITSYPESSLIINTSCEHLDRFDDWYQNVPAGSAIAIQSNNFFDCDQHSNCVKDLEEFKESAPMTTVYFQGQLELPKYTRFMLIGVK